MPSSWRVVSDLPGRLRAKHTSLLRRKTVCQEIERALMDALGVERFRTSSSSSSVVVHYDPDRIAKRELLRVLDDALHNSPVQPHPDRDRNELLFCTVAVAASAVAQFAAPVLLAPVAALFIYCDYPTFVGAYETVIHEHRLGVDALDSIVVVLCLGSAEIFAGCVLAWCLAFGRQLLEKAREDSRRRLVSVFGKQPRTAFLHLDGVDIEVPLDEIKPGDVIAVHTGEVIPVDGVVCEGQALVDQHMLTGEFVPAEKESGSPVFALTLVIGGRLLITVERAGKETTSAKISTILNETATFRLTAQSKGEMLADKAVLPTLGLAALGYPMVGVQGAAAILNCDFGTAIRMAGPLAMLSSLSACANRGILIKDGHALEDVGSIDTVLFDKTGTLTKDIPAVHRIHCFAKLTADEILTAGAAAEDRLDHPIAKAIVEKFQTLGKPLPSTDQSLYRVGYGIVGDVAGRRVHCGSSRFMKTEGLPFGDACEEAATNAQSHGHSIVFVAVEGEIAGAIELAPALRDGVPELIAGLRKRGIRQIVIISGDHDAPTRQLAQSLGVDRYFAEVLPEDKARYVTQLQQEGAKVCFVGDGINDAIALKSANVSVSLRGAASVATDTAQVVFMQDSLSQLLDVIDISRALDRNIMVSWRLILVPNALCIAGAFFLGFGVMASVLANNVAAIAALLNGLRPLGALTGPPRNQRSLVALPPRGKRASTGTRTVAVIFVGLGLIGLALPGIPGWPFLLVSIPLFSAGDPRNSAIDQWLKRKFPTARRKGLEITLRMLKGRQDVAA
jgi:Cu2+-exporting ATPase